MPLTLANPGEEAIIRKVGGKPEIKKHLEDLGFVPGGRVMVISAIGRKCHRERQAVPVAISQEMAQKILV